MNPKPTPSKMNLKVRRTFFRHCVLLSALLLLASFAANAAVGFTPGNLVVVRLGDGSAALTSTATNVFLEERTTNGTPVGSLVALPPNGASALVMSGSATSEGALNRSPDGQYLVIAGYNTSAGTLNVAASASATVPRVIGLINSGKNLALAAVTTTGYSANNIRSGTTDGANNFWGTGPTAAAGGGIYYLGNNAASATVVSVNSRVVQDISGNLFYSTGSGTPGIYQVSGAPKTAATSNLVVNTSTSGSGTASPYDFAFNPAFSTVYVADDRSIANGGGIQRWIGSGSTWTLAYTLGTGSGSTVGTRGMAVDFSSSSPVIYATTAEATGNRVIRIVDIGPGSAVTTLATAAVNTIYRGLDWTPQTPTPIVLTVPANITVPATSPSGAVVFFSASASGGCTTPTVVANPPSGSTFPIGTTIVNVTASDTCGTLTNKTFSVIVTPLPTPQASEYFSISNSLPPTGVVYINPFAGAINYGASIRIQNVRHRNFTQSYPPPALGTSQTETFSSDIFFDLSTDGGASFVSSSGTANVTVQVTHGQDAGGISFFNTEVLQLDLTGPGFILRESPTLQSTGQTTVRPVSGGYMISSFFDIFTEVSLDNGISWTPASNSHHVEMRPDVKQVVPVNEPTPLLPPPGGAYVSPQQWHALFAQGIVIKDVSHRLFTGSLQPPTSGGTNVHNFNSQLDLQVSTDGGNTYQSVRVVAPVQVSVVSHGSVANPLFDTEMTSLGISLPSGVMIRESPTEPSRGQTEVIAQSDGTYRVSSFFDIFTELSLDGGATWSPATNGPVRVQLVEVAPEGPKATPNLPPPGGAYVSPQQWHALYANGIIITNASHDRFTQNQPPPPAGGNATENFGSTVSGLISLNGGASFQPFSAPASVAVQVNSRADLDTGNTRFFDTEMLSLNLSGGSLPGGMLVRESPSKASLGRTSERSTPGGYMVSSFFDIFTEVSLDGGQTWSPSITKPGTMGLQTNTPTACVVSINCPASITVTSVGPAVVFFTVGASDTCNNPLTVTSVPPSGSTFPVGTTTVTNSAFNADGSAICTFTITVVPKPRVFPNGGKLPPTNSVYISPAMWHAAYANGIYISNVIHRAFTANFPPPPVGSTSNEVFGSKVDFMYSSDNGKTFHKYTGNATCTVKVTNGGSSGGGQAYQTEMLQLDLSGGTLPAGVMLRESPTKQSTGQTMITPTGTGTYQISSFFDIWTELSTDGGQTWMPSSSAGNMELHIDPANPPTMVVQPHFQGNQMLFNVPTQPGLRYTVRYTDDLNSQNWSVLTVISGNGQNLAVSDPLLTSPPHRFYQVVIDEDPNQ